MTAHRQRGLTLIELMIAMAVGSLVVWFVLSMHVRLSNAYRRQVDVTAAEQLVRTAHQQIVSDVQLAGHMISEFQTAAAADVLGGDFNTRRAPLSVKNKDYAGTSPSDTLRVYYGDGGRQSFVVSAPPVGSPFDSIQVADPGLFDPGQVLVISVNETVPIWHRACVVQFTDIDGGTGALLLQGGPWNISGNPQCAWIQDRIAAGVVARVMPFVARAYRIDPDNPAGGVLEFSRSGDLLDDWTPLGVGFYDLQIALRVFERFDATDTDNDGDPEREWYSSDNMQTSPPVEGLSVPGTFITRVTVSLAGRARVSGVESTETPNFTADSAATNPIDHNMVGDRPAEPITGYPGDRTDPRLRGAHVYRWASTTVETRNIGNGD